MSRSGKQSRTKETKSERRKKKEERRRRRSGKSIPGEEEDPSGEGREEREGEWILREQRGWRRGPRRRPASTSLPPAHPCKGAPSRRESIWLVVIRWPVACEAADITVPLSPRSARPDLHHAPDDIAFMRSIRVSVTQFERGEHEVIRDGDSSTRVSRVNTGKEERASTERGSSDNEP